VLVHQAQAFALALREQVDRIVGDVDALRHVGRSKRPVDPGVYFKAKPICR
jgi:hypothetical protein